jgi:hypothetical protein
VASESGVKMANKLNGIGGVSAAKYRRRSGINGGSHHEKAWHGGIEK